jgi:hypothetical protein
MVRLAETTPITGLIKPKLSQPSQRYRDCIQRKTWGLMPECTTVTYPLPYLIVNCVVSYSPTLQRERGEMGNISPIG